MTDRSVADVAAPGPAPTDERSLAAAVAPHAATIRPGGATPSSTRSTSAASPTATATARATSPASAPASRYLQDLGVDAHLVHPLVRVAARRRRLRRRRLPRDPPGLRHARGGRAADRARPSSSASGRSSTSSPTTSPSEHPWFQAALARRARLAGARRASGSTRAGATTATRCPTDWVSNFQGTPGRRTDEPRRHARGVVPAPLHARAARPQLEPPRRARRARGHPPLLVRPRRRRRPHRLGGPADQGPGRCPRSRDDPAPASTRPQDRDELHDIYRRWRPSPTPTPGTRVLVGEIWLPDVDRFAPYLRPDELHTAFNFDFLARPWDAAELRASIDPTLAAHAPVGAPATWVLSNHDVTRPVTRYGREDTLVRVSRASGSGTPTDVDLGQPPGPRRGPAHRGPARLALHLPGRRARPRRGRGPPVERAPGPDALPLGRRRPRPRRLPRAAALVRDDRAVRVQPGGEAARRPGCPARRTGRAHGRGAGGRPGLDARLYRAALRDPATEPGLGDGPFAWLASDPAVLAFARGDDFVTSPTFGPRPVARPTTPSVLLASADAARRPPAARRHGLAAPGPRRRGGTAGGATTTIDDALIERRG